MYTEYRSPIPYLFLNLILYWELDNVNWFDCKIYDNIFHLIKWWYVEHNNGNFNRKWTAHWTSPDPTTLVYYLWGWMKYEAYKIKVNMQN